VFVWSISENCKINSIRYANSIISLSFQPHGPYIAVASGVELRLWNWAENARLSIDGPSGNIKYSRQAGGYAMKHYPRMKIVKHARNIRAVLFHPFGRTLLTAAPDVAKKDHIPMVFSRLYAFDIQSIAMTDAAGDADSASAGEGEDGPLPVAVVQLWTLPHILPQVHLYSDGGLDISSDGRFLLVCSILYRRDPAHSPLLEDSSSADSVSGDSSRDELDKFTDALSGLSLGQSTAGNAAKPELVHIDAYVGDISGHTAQSSLCLYEFSYPVPNVSDVTVTAELELEHNTNIGFRNAFLSDIPYPRLDLLQCRTITESLMKAITSVKLSPTSRYGLLGYGVRKEGRVEAHRYGHVASEVISLRGGDLGMAAVMTDEVDEVNIAQFHPLPGGGLIYGTKRGRVRVFKRASVFKTDVF
jgi:WD40 repeat protein